MSFSSETKSELITLAAHKSCCRHALATGLLFDADTDGDSRTVLTLHSKELAEFAKKSLSAVFGNESLPYEPVYNGARGYDLAIISEDAPAFVGILPLIRCSECIQHFLRGLFIALGSVTDPERQYHIEFKLAHDERLADLSDYLSDTFDKRPITVSRKSGSGLVYKNSSLIEDVLTACGANHSLFTLINTKIESELRNNANRATNCETRNIANAVAASEKQIAAIDALDAAGELDKLPVELRETAQLRRLYPDMPLSELGARHAPPISKSGINHRIKKLLDAAEKLRK